MQTLPQFLTEYLRRPRERAFAERLGAPEWRFTSTTRMLERAGFRVTSLRQVPRPDWLQLSAARCAGASPWQRTLTLRPLAQIAAWGCYLAGHTDALLATAEVAV